MPERSIVNGPKVSSMPQEASAQPLTQLLSQLPSTDRLVSSPVGQALVQQHGATLVTQQATPTLLRFPLCTTKNGMRRHCLISWLILRNISQATKCRLQVLKTHKIVRT
ncbi:MAG: hypothetical protein EBR02_08655 [Alphaproteobacteria bacterium]|nr:hypothetical protein [Alphaproteobacteria bacterium]